MNHSEKAYYIGGQRYSDWELLDLCDEKLATTKIEFERDLYSLIKEWFSPSGEVLAKTSGSTGKPKEILLQKKYMHASAKATNSFFRLKEKDRVLACLPMNFIAGKMMVIRALVGSLDLHFTEPSSSPEIPEYDIEFSAMVPLQMSNLLTNNKSALSKISKLIIGGSFIPVSLLNQLQNLDTEVWQTYGMTETMTHIAVRKLNGTNKSAMYKPLSGVEIRVEDGQVIINAPHLGVKNLLTNDLAEVYSDGMFKILGRADLVITSGGLKMHPEEIELKISGILDCDYMIGSKKDDNLGEKLVLFIEKGENNERLVFNYWEKIEKVLEKNEIPKEIIFVTEIFKTASGKIDRKRLTDNN
jgi:O-succinylbenzoic acid--CoA ligase